MLNRDSSKMQLFSYNKMLLQLWSAGTVLKRDVLTHWGSFQNKIWNLPDWSTILPKFIYGKEGKLAGPTQVLPVRVRGPALILKTVQAKLHFGDDIFKYILFVENVYFDSDFSEICSQGSNQW